MLSVSKRTVRYDLEALDEELEKRGWRLHKKAQKGIWLEALKRAEYGQIKNDNFAYYEYVLSKNERCHAIVVHILTARKFIAIERLAEKLSISRSTLRSDLDSTKSQLDKYQLGLCSKRGQGLWIEGNEEDIRNVLIYIFSACLHDFSMAAIDSEDSSYETVLFKEYTAELPVKEIAGLFMELINENKLACYDFSINHMVVALLVQLKRLEEGQMLKAAGQKNVEEDIDPLLGALSRQISEYLTKYNQKFQERAEMAFLAKQLLSSKIYFVTETGNAEPDPETINLMALNIARTFVKHCQVWLGDIYLDDEELLYNLALHLQPAVKRAKYGIELTNPLLPQIRQQYGNLFMIAFKAAKEIEQKLEIKISEDEIGYLAVHLGGAIERKRYRHSNQLQVILVCGNGLGTANLLAMTLKNRLSCLHIKKIVPAYELNQEMLKGIDLVISSIALKLEDAVVLRVSPILSNAEIKVIEGQIQYFYHKKFAMAEKIEPRMHREVRLADILLPEMIALDVEAANWEEAIRAAGQLLVDNGSAESRYIESMIACVKKIGPYIVIGQGLAMPHSRAEDGVRKICLSMVRLARPVNFGSALHDPIDLVFAFGAVDSKSHLHVLYELWQVFYDAEALEKLRKCKDKVEIAAMMGNFTAAAGNK